MTLSPSQWFVNILKGICWEYTKTFLGNPWGNFGNSPGNFQELVLKKLPRISPNLVKIFSSYSLKLVTKNSLELVTRTSSEIFTGFFRKGFLIISADFLQNRYMRFFFIFDSFFKKDTTWQYAKEIIPTCWAALRMN